MPGSNSRTSLAAWLRDAGHEVIDLGTNSARKRRLSRFGARLAEAVADGRADTRHRGLRVGDRHCHRRQSQPGLPLRAGRRAALGQRLPARHNDANAIALGARLIGVDMAKACVTAFLATDFEGGRHQRRVDMLNTDC